MNPRERALAIVLIAVILLGGGGFFGYQFVYVPWSAKTKQLKNLQNDYRTKVERRDEIEREKGKLARWRMLSLPADPEVANREYEKYLNELLSHHKIVNGREIIPPNKQDNSNKTDPTTSDKQPIYRRLTFQVHAYATMNNLVAMLRDFYSAGLMQQIKSLTIQRQLTPTRDVRPDELEVKMTVEALIVTGADKRAYLMPNFDRSLMMADITCSIFKAGRPLVLLASASPGLSSPGLLAEPPRNYEVLAKKNVFLGRQQVTQEDGTPQWMAPRFVHLTDISPGTLRTDAMLYDVLTDRKMKLRESTYSNTFTFVRDGMREDGTSYSVADGAVVKIDDRDVIYRVEFHLTDDPERTPGFSRPSKADREKLVADEVIRTGDADAVLRVNREYWEMLLRTLIVRKRYGEEYAVRLERAQDTPVQGEDQGTSIDVLRCKVLHQDSRYVYVRPEEAYYNIHIGDSVEDSLKKALPGDKVKELKQEMTGK
jgi:hypothetical protein